MFEPRRLCVTYRIERPEGRNIDVVIRLDEHGFLENVSERGPKWTEIDGKRCKGCTLGGKYCAAALAIVPVVDAFLTASSIEEVDVTVELPSYTSRARVALPRVLSSVMGLMLASSRCPTMRPFRAMAQYHQPLATLEETVIRAAGFMLLSRWAHDQLCASAPFDPLIKAWQEVEEVNRTLSHKLRSHCETDGALNAIASLDMFAKAGIFGLESALCALKPALLAWDLEG